MTNHKLQYALDLLEDTFVDYFYYDRKYDENLTKDDMKYLVESGKLTDKLIIDKIKEFLPQMMKDNF